MKDKIEIVEIDAPRLRDRLENLIDGYGLDNILSQLEDICRSSDGYDQVADELKTARHVLEVVDSEVMSA